MCQKLDADLIFILFNICEAYTCSVYATVLISLERFIAVVWPLKSRQLLSSRNIKMWITGVLVFAISLNSTRWIESYEWTSYSATSESWNDYYKPTLMRIQAYRTIYHGWIWTTFMYIFPFVFIGFFNYKLVRHVRLISKSLKWKI
jgi:7 transmembrane receptor (rhodopsin family)